MCVYIVIIAKFLPAMPWRVDSAPAFKCNIYRLKPWLAGHLRQCTLEGEVWNVNVGDSVHWEGVYKMGESTLRVQHFLINY